MRFSKSILSQLRHTFFFFKNIRKRKTRTSEASKMQAQNMLRLTVILATAIFLLIFILYKYLLFLLRQLDNGQILINDLCVLRFFCTYNISVFFDRRDTIMIERLIECFI